MTSSLLNGNLMPKLPSLRPAKIAVGLQNQRKHKILLSELYAHIRHGIVQFCLITRRKVCQVKDIVKKVYRVIHLLIGYSDMNKCLNKNIIVNSERCNITIAEKQEFIALITAIGKRICKEKNQHASKST